MPFSSEVQNKRKADSASGHPFMQNTTPTNLRTIYSVTRVHLQSDQFNCLTIVVLSARSIPLLRVVMNFDFGNNNNNNNKSHIDLWW